MYKRGIKLIFPDCEKLDLICKRAVWDTGDECYCQDNYKGIDDCKLRNYE